MRDRDCDIVNWSKSGRRCGRVWDNEGLLYGPVRLAFSDSIFASWEPSHAVITVTLFSNVAEIGGRDKFEPFPDVATLSQSSM